MNSVNKKCGYILDKCMDHFKKAQTSPTANLKPLMYMGKCTTLIKLMKCSENNSNNYNNNNSNKM